MKKLSFLAILAILFATANSFTVNESKFDGWYPAIANGLAASTEDEQAIANYDQTVNTVDESLCAEGTIYLCAGLIEDEEVSDFRLTNSPELPFE